MSTSNPVRKVVVASVIGATIEWYDFFLYGVVAGIVFNHLYFPSDDPLISTMLAYGTFAVGFLSRPIGGVIFGHFGDKIGRKIPNLELPWSSIHTLITDERLSAEAREQLTARGINLICAAVDA